MVTYKNGNTYTHLPSNKDKVDFDYLEQHGGDPVAFLARLGITGAEIVEGAQPETVQPETAQTEAPEATA